MENTKFEVGEEFFYYGNQEELHGRKGKVILVYGPDKIGPEETYRCVVEGYKYRKRLPAHKMRKIEVIWEV